MKLQARQRLRLGPGRYFIPIFNKADLDVSLSQWWEAGNPRRRRGQLRFICAVRIPDSQLVVCVPNFEHRNELHDVQFRRPGWMQIVREMARPLRDWGCGHSPQFSQYVREMMADGVTDLAPQQVILAEPLSRRQVLWTKDLRLLRRKR